MSPISSRKTTLLFVVLVALLAVHSLLFHLKPVAARPFATFVVSNTSDSGAGSLRQAILDANATLGEDLIEITAVGTLNLQSALPLIDDPVTIQGSGTDQFIVDGPGAFRIFDILLAAVSISDLTIQHGNVSGAGVDGGGIRSNFRLTLTNVAVLSNTAEGYGGGVYVTGNLTVTNSLFQGNSSTTGVGGGLFGSGEIQVSDVQFNSNTSQLSGGGFYALGELALTDSHFQGNQCLASNCDGGGLFSFSRTTIHNTQFLSNTAQSQGGGASAPGVLTITEGLFQYNQTTFGTGGGLFGQDSATLINTQIRDNTAGSWGGGMYMLGAVTVTSSLFEGNRSINQAGGGLFAFGGLTVDSSQFIGNVAAEGGGLVHGFDKDGRLTNTLFANNQATNAAGAALLLESSGHVALIHLTVGGQSVTGGSAVEVLTGTVGITNTIVVSHAIGISNSGGLVSQDYTLFFGTGQNTQGAVTGGANSVQGDSKFQDPGQDDYHLSSGSAAIDAGINANVPFDFEGDGRPLGNGFDIGYDEAVLRPEILFLPLLVR